MSTETLTESMELRPVADVQPQGPSGSTIPQRSALQSVTIILVVSGATFLNSMVNGLLIVGLPTIAKDLGLASNLIFWPSSVFSLACGSTLLLSGSIADILGARPLFLLGSGVYMILTLITGFLQTGIQLIVFRALQGVSLALCLPSAVSILSSALPQGRWRNMGFGALGAGQPVGFAAGLVVSGGVLDNLGWRWAFWIVTAISALVTAAAFLALPKDTTGGSIQWKHLSKIDWTGAVLSSTSLGLLSYVMALVGQPRSQWNLLLLILPACLSTSLGAAFFYWVHRQEKLGKPCMIPLSLFRNRIFSSICAIIFLTWATFNSLSVLLTLVFQEVQNLSALETSIRFIPDVVMGILINLGVGFLIHKMSTYWLILISTIITLAAPLCLTTMNKDSSYWVAAFPAMCLIPLSADVLYTVSNLVISSSFPENTQGLAGGVFNVIVQVANSVGLGITSIIATTVSASKSASTPASSKLMSGYHASFWVCFGGMVVASAISGTTLRGIGRIGQKRD